MSTPEPFPRRLAIHPPPAAFVILSAIALLLLLGISAPAAIPGPAMAAAPPSHTTVTTTTVTIAAHVVEPALVQQLNPTYNMTYYRFDRSRYDPGRIENRTFTLIVLENDYLKLTILPELGGRIYQAIFKPTGHNMFYQNPVLKPSPWGPPEMGWWLAVGGMEWCLPVEEHGYEWGVPWQYAIDQRADGVTVNVWDTDAADRLRARISITLLDGEARFRVTPTLENPTGQPIDYKFWLNAMLAPGGANAPGAELRILMPTDQVTVHSTGDPRLPGAWVGISWPVYNGVDWSRLGNWRQWFGFFQRPQAAGDFQAVYDQGYDEGAVRTYDSRVAHGAKFFAFGWGTQAIQPDLYTDDRSSYVEMHGGVAPTFADTRRLEAGQRITWDERWYPVAGLGGLTWANADVALAVESAADGTSLGVATTRPRSNVRVMLLRRSDNAVLLDETVTQVVPGQPYRSARIGVPSIPLSNVGVLVYSDGVLLGAYQYQGQPPTGTVTPGPTPTASAVPAWSGRVLRLAPIGGWTSVARIWVRGQYGLPVVIRAAAGGWSAVNWVGSKPEYGSDALEFAPLGPGQYVIEPQGLGVSVTVDLPPGTVAEVLFEPAALPIGTPTVAPPTGTPTASPTAQPPTGTPTATATPTPTPSAQPPTGTPTPTATATSPAGWSGRELAPIAIPGGWSCVVRVWVRGQYGLPVTIRSADGSWSTVNWVGSKPEYGPDALEFAPLGPGRYVVTPQGLGVSVTVDLPPGRIAQVLFERGGPATPTPTPTPTPVPGAWRVRIPTNTTLPGTWFGVIRVSVQGQIGTLVRIASADGSWSTTNRTGTKPEYGPTFLEFAPLGAGTYVITAEGVPVSATLTLGQGGVAVVLFER
jgi:hypothetical protein